MDITNFWHWVIIACVATPTILALYMAVMVLARKDIEKFDERIGFTLMDSVDPKATGRDEAP